MLVREERLGSAFVQDRGEREMGAREIRSLTEDLLEGMTSPLWLTGGHVDCRGGVADLAVSGVLAQVLFCIMESHRVAAVADADHQQPARQVSRVAACIQGRHEVLLGAGHVPHGRGRFALLLQERGVVGALDHAQIVLDTSATRARATSEAHDADDDGAPDHHCAPFLALSCRSTAPNQSSYGPFGPPASERRTARSLLATV